MSTRFYTNAAIALLAGLVVVLSVGMSSTTGSSWVAFGIAIGVVAISGLAQLDTRRSGTQRVVDAVMSGAAGALIGVSVVFHGGTVRWLDFALALGLIGIAFVGMSLHEIESWRSTRELGQLHWLAPEAVPQARRAGVRAN